MTFMTPSDLKCLIGDALSDLEVTIKPNDCKTALAFYLCDEPPVIIKHCDFELIPDATTCLYNKVTQCYEDGVETGEPVITPTSFVMPSTYTSNLICNEGDNFATLVCIQKDCKGDIVDEKRTVTDIPCDITVEVKESYVCDGEFYTQIVTAYDTSDETNPVVVGTPVETVTDIPCNLTVRKETKFVCNDDTGFYDEIVYSYDYLGNQIGDPVVTESEYSCAEEEKVDVEFFCASDDNRLIKLVNNTTTGATELQEIDGTPVPAGVNAVNCEQIGKYIGETCYEDADDADIKYTQIRCFSKDDPAGTLEVLRLDADGNITTTQPKNSVPCKPIFKFGGCAKDRFIEWGGDNSKTNWKDTNVVLDALMSDGTTGTAGYASATSWSNQVDNLTAAIASFTPDAVSSSSYCNLPGGCGGLPEPILPLTSMFARYSGMKICVGGVYPVSIKYSSDQRKDVDLVLEWVESDDIYYDLCRDCDGNKSYRDQITGEVVTPICPKPCGHVYPEIVEPLCTYETIKGCDIQLLDADGELLETPIANPMVGLYTICGGDVEIGYYLEEDGALIDYNEGNGLIGYFGDCDTLLPIEGPAPECPDGATRFPMEKGGKYNILDNSLWDGLPVNHLQNGQNYKFKLNYSDGTAKFAQQGADPYFNNLMQVFADVTGCKVIPVCANHTAGKGCHPIHVANLANYPAYDSPTFPGDAFNTLSNPGQAELWATGRLFDCGDCVADLVSVEIVEANDPTHVGAIKTVITHQKEKEIVWEARVCGAKYYQDCDGNAIPNPDCCLLPYTGPALDLSKYEVDCCGDKGIEGANYDGAIAITRGRPLPTVPWALIDNRDPNNQVTIASGNTFQEFSADLASKGYSEFINGEIHYICPCPAGLVNPGDYFVTADGDTVTKPACEDGAKVGSPCSQEAQDSGCEKKLGTKDCNSDAILDAILNKGTIESRGVCFTDGTTGYAILEMTTAGTTLLRLEDEIGNVVTKTVGECDCGCDDGCPKLTVGDITNTDTSATLTTPINATNEFINWTIPFMLEPGVSCIDENPKQEVVVRITQDHEAGSYDGHRAYVMSASAGTFDAVSASNSQAPASGNANQQIGYAVGDAANNGQSVVRRAELTLTVGDLLSGVSISSLAFGGAGGAFEILNDIKIEIVSGLEGICDC